MIPRRNEKQRLCKILGCMGDVQVANARKSAEACYETTKISV